MSEAAPRLQSVPRTGGVYAKIALVMGEIDRLPKDKKNQHFGYAFTSEAAVKAALRPLFAKHGLVCLPSVEHYEHDGDITRLRVALLWVDCATGESVTTYVIGEGQDKQDKGPAKALTLAVKYGLLNSLLIDTGEDPDGDAHTQPAQRGQARPAAAATTTPKGDVSGARTDAQVKAIFAAAKSAKVGEDDLRALIANACGEPSTKALTAAQATKVIAGLQEIAAGRATLDDLLPPQGADEYTVPGDTLAEMRRLAKHAGINEKELQSTYLSQCVDTHSTQTILGSLTAEADKTPF